MPRADATFKQTQTLAAAAANLTGGASPAAGSKWIIRHIHFANTSAVAVPVTLSIGADAVGTRLVSARPVPANDVFDMYGVWEMPASTDIQGFAGTATVVTVEVSGTLNTP
jgi:hypothetical protein